MRSFAISLAILVAACGSAGTSETTELPDESPQPTSSTAASETTTTTTAITTTTATSTTTLPQDPGELLVSQLTGQGVVESIDAAQALSMAESTCVEAEKLREDEAWHIEDATAFILSIPNITRGGTGRAAAILVETHCPEQASKLALTSAEYATAFDAELEVGDCFVAWSSVAAPIDCGEPHNGQVAAFVDAAGSDYPQQQDMMDFFSQIDCRTPIAEFLGADPNTVSSLLMAENEDEWNAGETRIRCSFQYRDRILVGSAAGSGEAMNEAAGSLAIDVATCGPETIELTATNTGTATLNAIVEISLPSGLRPSAVLTDLPAGESQSVSMTVEEVEGAPPPECNSHFIAAVPSPLPGG